MDLKAFVRADLTPRTEDVTVAALAPWNDGKAPTVTVRGLTGPELARVREAAEKLKDIGKIIEAAVGGTDKERVQATREMWGIADDLTEDYAKRVEMLAIASVSPAMDRQTCLKLAVAFPVEFYDLTNRITVLTGMGHAVPGKPAPSTETAEFERP